MTTARKLWLLVLVLASRSRTRSRSPSVFRKSMAKLLFFVLVLYLFIAQIHGGQVAIATASSFGIQSTKPARRFFLMEVACNSSKRSVLMSVEVGSEGEERIILHYLEHGANVCPSAPRPVEETVIDIDSPRFQTAPSSPYVGERRNNSSLKVDGADPRLRGHPRRGPGAGGGGPGGGGGGPDGNSDSDSLSKGRNTRSGDGLSLEKFHAALKKLAKISIFISAQTGTTLLFVTGGTPKSIFYSIVAINVCSYLFCMFSFLVSESKPLVGTIISAAGSLFAASGFLLTMCLIIPPEFICLLVISAILLFFSLLVLSFY